MFRSALSKVMWVGRATVFLVGLSVILALLFGVATTALAGTGVGATFDLGRTNTVDAISKLVGSTASSMLMVDNDGGGAALDLRVGSDTTPARDETVAPMRVDSQARVANLNVDELDGKDSTDFVPSLWAKVSNDGTLLAGKGATSVTTGGGGYFVRFDRDITNCAYIATVGQQNTAYFDPGEIQAIHTTGNQSPDRDVYVAISDNESGAIQRGFSLVVVC